jgi:hypothetical protein
MIEVDSLTTGGASNTMTIIILRAFEKVLIILCFGV